MTFDLIRKLIFISVFFSISCSKNDFTDNFEKDIHDQLSTNVEITLTKKGNVTAKIKSEVLNNPLLENQLNESCKKILMLKKWANVFRPFSGASKFSLESSNSQLLNRELSKNAITVLKNSNVLPIELSDSLKIACLLMGSDSGDNFYNRINI